MKNCGADRIIFMSEIVIIGIGQELRGDDAIGPVIVREWQNNNQSSDNHLRAEICPLPGLELLDLFEDAHTAILVDAVQSGAKPGTVHITDMNQLVSFGVGSGSVHGFGVAETLALGKQIDPSPIPERLIVIGIEILHLDLGEPISQEVRESIPIAISEIENIIHRYSFPIP